MMQRRRHLTKAAIALLCATATGSAALAQEFPEAQSLSGLEFERISRDALYAFKALDAYQQAPMLDALVDNGTLPPVEERLPPEPLVFLEGAMSDGIGTYGGIFRHVIGGRPEGWNWLAGQAQGWGGINIAIQECLVRQGPRWQIRADDQESPLANLARDWEWSEDRQTLTMHLIEGARWSDGDPFDTEDIRFWWENNVEDANVPSFLSAGSFGSGTQLTIIDDYSFSFSFDSPQGPILVENLAFPNGCPGPSHILKDQHPAFNDEATYDSYRAAMPAEDALVPVLGAWAPALHRPDELVVLRRNPYYWKVDEAGNQLPYYNEMQFKLTTWDDRTTQTIAGTADFSNLQNPANYVEVLRQSQQPDAAVSVQFGPRVLAWRLTLNLSEDVGVQDDVDTELRQLFRDNDFRLALSHALDRDAIGNAVARGPFAHPYTGGFAVGSPYFDRSGTAYHPFDLDRANALLDGLGLEDTDGNGIRNMPETGDDLTIDVIFLPNRTEDRRQLDAVVAQLAEVGVRLLPRGTDETNRDVNVNSGNFNAVFERATFVLPTRLTCDNLPVGPNCPSFHRSGPDGRSLLEFEEALQETYARFLASDDQAERAALAVEIQRLTTEGVYNVGTVQFPGALLINKRVRNAHPGTPVFMFEWAEDAVIRERLWTPAEEQLDELMPGVIAEY